MPASVTFIGLGTMGLPMVRNLAAGMPVAAYDVNPKAVADACRQPGVTALADPRHGAAADIVVLMLPDSGVVRRALGDPDDPESFAACLHPGALVVDMGSSNPESTTELAAELARHTVALVDAPVSGGPRKAAVGELTVMAGGNPADVQRATPVLRTMGSSVTHTGPVGSAHALKALNNLLSAVGLVGALEVLTVGKKFGLDPSVMLSIINASTGRNQSTEVKIGPEVLEGRLQVGFSLALTVKDVTTALNLARSLAVPSPVAEACVGVCREALTALGADGTDQSEIARHLAATTGVDLIGGDRTGTVHGPRAGGDSTDADHGPRAGGATR